ncbi:MAG TPA: UbiH/UbiF/VisC/COQ6 family ubiquinone biosynthesis hydroxylase [Caulobacteraceae bacterium]|jgi:2-octaprenyl-6-methoxyphenol hydroxylase
MSEFDVIIAGAGMAGATLALALKRAGMAPLLVDRQSVDAQLAPSYDGRASAVAYSCFRQWRALGVAGRLEPHAQRIDQILVTDGRGPGAGATAGLPAFLHFDASEIADRSEGEPLGYMVENRHIRAALAEAVREAGVEVAAPVAIEGLRTGPAAAAVALADGREVMAPLVVGADGRESAVRREAGIGVVGWPYRQSAVVATLGLAEPHGGVAYEHFLPSGPFAILPLTGSRACLVWTESHARAQALKAARPEMFEACLRRRFGDFLGEVEVLGQRFFYPLSLQLAERMTAPRVALLGDAAHAIHPIAGQGLNLGLKDVAALAEVVVEAARLGEDIGSEAVLERYARWRRTDTVALSVATDVFDRLFSTDLPPVRLARGLGMAAVNRLAPARRWFMTEAGGASGDLPRLLRGESL